MKPKANKGDIPLPDSIGKRRRLKVIDGSYRDFTIEDEITTEQPVPEKGTRKVIYFQKIRFEDNRETQYRLTYYMLGVKPGARGKWVLGQYSILIPAKHLAYLLKEAKKRKWKGS